MTKYYDKAHKISFRGENNHHQLGAIVFKGGAIISRGWNHGWNHAEAVALRKHGKYKGAKMAVARSNHRISKPCAECLAKIKAAGIVKVIYVDRDLQIRYVGVDAL